MLKLYRCNLRSHIDAQPTNRLLVGDARKFASVLCMTLEQLHKVGVIVQDIKPENILLDDYNNPVFADFGISSVVTRTTSIMPTTMKGTFNYMSPEAFDPPFNFKSDVWSMACVVLEMYSGVVPWPGMQMQQIMMAVTVKKRHPDIPDEIPAAETIRRCFRFKAAERPSAAELGNALAPEQANVPEIVGDIAQKFAGQVERLTQQNEANKRELEQSRKKVKELKEENCNVHVLIFLHGFGELIIDFCACDLDYE